MAPLRSSRHTRHHDPNTSTRAGRATTDFDPTDGLPVRRFLLESMSINQDASAETADPANAANKTGLPAKDNFPWPEQPLPTFFDQLPAHNQELLRRARAGERETKASIWDRKSKEWVRYDEARKRGLTGESGMRKSRYLMNVTNEDGEENAAENDDDASDDNSDDENNDGDEGANGDGGATNGAAKSKKRKQPPTQLLQDRTFDVKKWNQVPFDKADKMPEPKYLADRRPGMPNYYNQSNQGAWAHAQGYGIGMEGAGAGPAYDLGDGSGLGSAMGGQQPGSETPVRKNMPPRPRKKKGGPGRKKKEVVEAERRAAEEARRKAEAEARGEVVAESTEEKKEDGKDTAEAGSETPRSKKEGGDGSGDESEGEGSEDGEINDGPDSGSATPSASGSVPPSSVPGLGLNVPAIPSSLSKEVAMGAAEDTAGSAPSPAAATIDDLPTAQPDSLMIDAPPSSITTADPAAPAPPAAPTSIPAASETPAPIRAQPATPTLEQSPITPPPVSAEDALNTLDAPTATSLPTITDPAPVVPASQQQQQYDEGTHEISVPFDPPAANEPAPLLEGIEVPTAAQVDAATASVPSVPADADADANADAEGKGEEGGVQTPGLGLGREEQAVREAVVQGEAREFREVEAGVVRDGGGVGEGGGDQGVEKEDGTKHQQQQQQLGDGKEGGEEAREADALDLLGGLEREVQEQEGRE